MIDDTDLLSLEIEVRSLIGEETAKFWTQARIFRAINAEVLRLARKVIGLERGYMEVIYTPPMAATVTLPPNCYLIRNVEVYIDSAWFQPAWISDHQRGHYQTTSTTFPSAVQFADNSIVFENGVGSASSLRIKYARLPASMIYGAATAGAAATITLPTGVSVYDDVYVGDIFSILAGVSVGDVRTASDYVGSTRVATVSAAWTSTPDTSSYISTLLPEPLAKYPDVVAQGTALRLLSRNRDAERYEMIADGYKMDLQDMMDTLSQRQTEQVQRGNYIPDGDE